MFTWLLNGKSQQSQRFLTFHGTISGLFALEMWALGRGSHSAWSLASLWLHTTVEGLIWGLRMSSLRLPQIYRGRFREEAFQSAMPAKHVHHLDSLLFMTA